MLRQSGGLRLHEQTEERIQRLPQHEGVLRANGDDQAPRDGHTLKMNEASGIRQEAGRHAAPKGEAAVIHPKQEQIQADQKQLLRPFH